MSMAERQPCAGYARFPHPGPCSRPPGERNMPGINLGGPTHIICRQRPSRRYRQDASAALDLTLLRTTRGHADRTSNPPRQTPRRKKKLTMAARDPRDFSKEEANEENTCDPFMLLLQRRVGPNRARADRQRQEQRKRHHLRHGLQPPPVQPVEPDQQIQHQAAGPGLEHEPQQRDWRTRAADDLQRRHVCGERTTGRSRSTSRPASRSGARR